MRLGIRIDIGLDLKGKKKLRKCNIYRRLIMLVHVPFLMNNHNDHSFFHAVFLISKYEMSTHINKHYTACIRINIVGRTQKNCV